MGALVAPVNTRFVRHRDGSRVNRRSLTGIAANTE